MADPRDFLLNTDYEMDKIVYFKEQLVHPDPYGFATISHSLGIAPLITGVWSKTKDFAEPHSFTTGEFIDPNTNANIIDTISCDASNTEISLSQYPASATFDYYVRLIGFEPSDSHAHLPATSNNAGVFILNTDYNYLKLFKAGVEEIVIEGIQPDAITVEHNLGYIPQSLFWVSNSDGNDTTVYYFELNELPSHVTESGTTTTIKGATVKADAEKFVIQPPTPQWGSVHKLHYRIYYDEAI